MEVYRKAAMVSSILVFVVSDNSSHALVSGRLMSVVVLVTVGKALCVLLTGFIFLEL